MLNKGIILIDRFHWVVLAAAAPFLLLPTPKRSVSLLIVPAIWLLNILTKRRRTRSQPPTIKIQHSNGFPVTPLNISLLVMAGMVLVSLWATYSITQSLEKISGLVLGFGVFYAVVRESRKPAGWWWSLFIFLSGGFGWAALGFLGMNYPVRFIFLTPVIKMIPVIIDNIPGAPSGLQHNAVGGSVVWFFPLMLTLSCFSLLGKFEKKDLPTFFRIAGIILPVGTIFVTLVILLTQSRGSYLATGLAILGIIFLVLPKKKRWILIVLLGITVVSLYIILVFSGGWAGLINQLGLSAEEGLTARTLQPRLEIWVGAINGIRKHPFTGIGMNTFREKVYALNPLSSLPRDIDLAHAHNEFLQAALDLGILGLIAFISINIIAYWMLIKIWKTTFVGVYDGGELPGLRDPEFLRVLVLGLGGGLFAHLIFGMLDAISLGAKPGIFFWYLLGLITGLCKLTTDNLRLKIVKNEYWIGDKKEFK